MHGFVTGTFAAVFPVTTGCNWLPFGASLELILDAEVIRPKIKAIA